MTHVIETNKAETARNDLSKGIASAWSGNVQSGNAIARIAADLLVMIGEGNGTVVFDTVDGVAVSFDSETLGRYARGTLPGKADDAKEMGLPTVSQMISAMADSAETVRNARDSVKAEQAAAKAAKNNPIIKAKHDAEAERLNQALNTLKAPIRRAFTLAAYVATSDAFTMSEASADNGKLTVPCLTGETDKEGNEVSKVMAITFATAREAFKGDSTKKRAAQTDTGNNVTTDADGNLTSVTMSPESVRNGGPARGKLADQLALMSGLLSDLDGAPNPREREAMQRLWVTLGSLLDDDAILEASEMEASKEA